MEDNFFSHMISSEGSFTYIILVTGPIGKQIGMNSGVGLFGHCQPANTIGRAVRLCLINLGYVWPGESDMALIGRPSSHTFYTFAENLEQSPWESFNEGLAYKREESCVTVSMVGGWGGMGMRIYGGGVVEPWNVDEVLVNLRNDVATDRAIPGAYKLGVADPFAHLRKYIMVIHPQLAIILQRHGYDTKQRLRDYLYVSTKVPYEELNKKEIKGLNDRINTTPDGMFFVNDAIPEKQIPVQKALLHAGGRVLVVNPDDIHIVVSGSIPGYSFGMSYMRTAHRTMKIKGASMTQSGR